MSTFRVSSVTGCSTWIRAFISRKKYSPVSASTRNSTVPALVYPDDLAMATAALAILSLKSGLRAVDGVSSITFW